MDKREIIKELGFLVRQERKRQNLTIEKLHHLSGVAFAQISLFELGKTDISTSSFFKITKALNIDLIKLLRSKVTFTKEDLNKLSRSLSESMDKLSDIIKSD